MGARATYLRFETQHVIKANTGIKIRDPLCN